MLSHDELTLCIKHQHPNSVHMVDFFVAMPVEASTGQQTGQAFIADWLLEAPRPTPEEIDTYETVYADILTAFRQPTPAAVDVERDRRIAAGFTFNGVFYQTRPEDRENIAGAAVAALAAIGAGAQVGNYRWHGGDTDFMWIAADNTMHPLDAQSTFAMGQAAMAHKQAHIFAARTLKDMNPIPADFTTNPTYWP
ncbi:MULTISPECIES: DUF4376 domain-containing protein [Agrobacterium tumefaciens complex]|uniref:XkdW family protein n=1 Tax=Agrobacterium tumefaciens complex TaxID=1183400 RepID=UPI000EF4840C|nr:MULTISPECIES: DUF4376 domain-containing protein [Agrobacterium tumefaciens complex]AYM56385.1 hypothetical protein At1D132_03680 [Agrobacterium fabrum]NSZ10760.1 DUF4376 domain-containing protein [Agrobacterium fabrum]